MRTIVLPACGLILFSFGIGCKRNKPIAPVVDVAPEKPPISATVHMADPQAAGQLLSGFHKLEENAWRWSMQRFTLAMGTPDGAAANGATLSLKFTLPEPVIAKLGAVTITAKVNGVALPSQVFKKSGGAEYSQPVPASALKGETATVEFALDKALAAGTLDQRELGVIVTQVSLDAK